MLVSACGGDDDEAAVTTTTTLVPIAATTLPPTTTTPPTTSPPTTTIAYVTEGATVVVANASGVNGAAGRMTDRLAAAGFSTTDATNSADSIGQLGTTRILHVADDAAAVAVAQSLREALGGGDIQVEETAIPVPTESGELGDATVLILMGNDIADKSLEELQGLVPAADEPATDEDGADDGTDTDEDGTGG